tara:strand:+ start:6435 stop:6980 length:546 start_codon:yes stop_codon:yes gene_type:complete
MKKLLLILICLFVSTEAKSKYIVLECNIKKTIYTINNSEGKFRKNILDTSFNMMTLYLDEKNQWLNSYKIDEEYLDIIILDENQNVRIDGVVKKVFISKRWSLRDSDDEDYNYNYKGNHRGFYIKDLDIDLNKDSGQLTYTMKYHENDKWNIYDKHFYKEGYYSDGFVSYGVCKKIKKSLF